MHLKIFLLIIITKDANSIDSFISLFRHSSPLTIVLDKLPKWYPVSAQSWWM